MIELNTIHVGDCLQGLKALPDNSVDCCISSPPYWGLRDYEMGAQIGQEPNFEKFVKNLIDVYTEVYRVLKPTGTCFVNLGDTYGGSGSGTSKHADTDAWVQSSKQRYVLPNGKARASKYRGTSLDKSLLMVPERFAIAMIDIGWTLRNQIIWHKPNQMPNSVKDRFTVDFEKIFFFTKQPRGYYFRQQLVKVSFNKAQKVASNKKQERKPHKNMNVRGRKPNTMHRNRMKGIPDKVYTHRNMRSVWSINTKPFSGAHFAVFPEALAERMVISGCPPGGVVLDPFMGAGTTAIAARKHGCNYIGYELNPKFVEIANKRLRKELGLFWIPFNNGQNK